MIRFYYDLHIHSALSPCADDDMTPCDIAGMAVLNGLDVIAVTDHNTFGNVQAVCEAAQSVSRAAGVCELLVIPGAEITTAEEVHTLCFFKSPEAALGFENDLSAYFIQRKNREDIFGKQILFDSSDNIAGTLERMLMAPTTITFDSLFALTARHGGAFIPAHIDRSSFSVTSNLGFLPPDLDIATVEVSARGMNGEDGGFDKSMFTDKKIISSSDSHQLHTISEKKHYIELPELTAEAIVDYLRMS